MGEKKKWCLRKDIPLPGVFFFGSQREIVLEGVLNSERASCADSFFGAAATWASGRLTFARQDFFSEIIIILIPSY